MMEDELSELLERQQHKYFGKYRGFVEDRDDPDQLGRLKLRVPSVLEGAVTGWAWPASPFAGAGRGFLFLPQKDDIVWVEFIEGELEHPVWSGGGWAKPGGTSEIPEDAKANYPDTAVLRTKFGLVIVMDDASGNEKIVIRAKNGCEVTLDPNAGQVTVKAQKVVIQDSGQQLQELATKAFVQDVFEKHKHGSGTGPTTPPLPPTPPPSLPQLTSVLKAE
ncbi:MAG TPA: phage baseplate assembly protein V [Polyangiaceae bacterium]|nr:phage baseplate assembly protein V [Polyangiaceae bacterium]